MSYAIIPILIFGFMAFVIIATVHSAAKKGQQGQSRPAPPAQQYPPQTHSPFMELASAPRPRVLSPANAPEYKYALAPKPKKPAATAAVPHAPHEHPADKRAEYVTERAFSQTSEWGGEGCEEHYFTRTIKEIENEEDGGDNGYLKLLILSDAILNRKRPE